MPSPQSGRIARLRHETVGSIAQAADAATELLRSRILPTKEITIQAVVLAWLRPGDVVSVALAADLPPVSTDPYLVMAVTFPLGPEEPMTLVARYIAAEGELAVTTASRADLLG